MTNKSLPNVKFAISRDLFMKYCVFSNSVMIKLQFDPSTKECVSVNPMIFSEGSKMSFQDVEFEQSRNKMIKAQHNLDFSSMMDVLKDEKEREGDSISSCSTQRTTNLTAQDFTPKE